MIARQHLGKAAPRQDAFSSCHHSKAVGLLGPSCLAGGAKAAVVGLGSGDDVLDVGLLSALEPCDGVGSIDVALSRNDLGVN